MSAIEQLVTDHLDLWSSAIKRRSTAGRGSSRKIELYGIKKLRELILELAVRGLLVPQDPNDEPASELLKKIAAVKARLVKEGKIKKEKPLPPICSEQMPFKLPIEWSWIRLGQLGICSTGRTPRTEEPTFFDGNIPFIGPGQISPKSELLDPEKFLSEAGLSESTEAKINDILMVCIGGSIGKSTVTNKRIAFNQQINAIRPIIIAANYLHRAISTNQFYQSIIEQSSGSATPIINRSKWEELLVPVCPENEQHRIVAKVDEMMALCDQLENETDANLSAHQTLVETLLATLTQAADHAQFSSAWERLAEHFDSLFTTEESIDQLKQTLLQLAVMGKLVPQDPNDEPARELLKKIAAEKARLVKVGALKKEKPLSPIGDEKKPFELPRGWAWARFPELGEFGRGKSKHRPRNDPKLFTPGIYPLVQTGEVARASGIITEYHSKYSEIGLSQSKMWPAGTLCITIAANIADSALLGFESCFPDSVVGFVPCKPLNDAAYLLTFMKTARAELLKFAPATAQKNINLEILESVLIPIPPKPEIIRISAKVSEMTALCDQLKSRLNDAQTTQLHLADAMAEKALARA